MTNSRVFLLAIALGSPIAARAEGQGPDTVVVQSGALSLRALLWRPEGRGPFPAVLFNHGSWPRDTRSGRPAREIFAQAASLGPVFARHGYVFLFLFRRGAGLSAGQGTHAGDLLERELAANGQAARNRLQVRLLERDELTDALAGLAFLRALPEVDSQRVAVAGHSFGGSLTLLLAERDSTLAAAVDFAGAAASWEPSPELRARLLTAVGATTVPIFFIHAANDYSLAPGKALAAEMARLGKPHRIKIFPPFGTTASQGHNLVDLSPVTWERDVFAFLDEHLRR
jgi:carboxymethylenebutenolidase